MAGVLALACAACAASPGTTGPASSASAPIRIGALFPLSGNAAGLAAEQLRGVRISFDLVNSDGGIGGHPLELVVHDLQRAADAPAAVDDLKRNGVQVVIGAYSSDLSIAASEAANAAGLVYWEAGAVADRLTARGLPLVFRVGASGSNLGTNSVQFAAQQLTARLGKRSPADLRLAIVAADDAYPASVADAARATAKRAGVPVVADETYRLSYPDWQPIMDALASAHPDLIVLASHIPDGVAFRRAMIAAGVHAGALIGSTMAQCDPDFAGDLGPDAVGVFASDRPTGGFQATALDPAARGVYQRFADAWGTADGDDDTDEYAAPSGEYSISGPIDEASGPSEEGLSGFTSGWVLAHDVLPKAFAAAVAPTAEGIAAAARSLDLPDGSLPNGAGVRFSSDPATLGQNERAVGVIWQWQAVRSYTFVWPPQYATGSVAFVPLER
jgi:branched-chain amino acid transport system substrate-binding protein